MTRQLDETKGQVKEYNVQNDGLKGRVESFGLIFPCLFWWKNIQLIDLEKEKLERAQLMQMLERNRDELMIEKVCCLVVCVPVDCGQYLQ